MWPCLLIIVELASHSYLITAVSLCQTHCNKDYSPCRLIRGKCWHAIFLTLFHCPTTFLIRVCVYSVPPNITILIQQGTLAALHIFSLALDALANKCMLYELLLWKQWLVNLLNSMFKLPYSFKHWLLLCTTTWLKYCAHFWKCFKFHNILQNILLLIEW